MVQTNVNPLNKVDIRDTFKWCKDHLHKMDDDMLKKYASVPITDWHYNMVKNIYFRMVVYLSADNIKMLKLETGFKDNVTNDVYKGDYDMDLPYDEFMINFAITHYVFGV